MNDEQFKHEEMKLRKILHEFVSNLQDRGFSEEDSTNILIAGTDEYSREHVIDSIYG